MPKYQVEVQERHIQIVDVEASSAEDAIIKVREGEGDYTKGTICQETLDPATWVVKDNKGNELLIVERP